MTATAIEKEEEARVEPEKPQVAVVLGHPGRRQRRPFIVVDDPLLQEFQGARLKKTLDRMLTDPIIAGIVDRTALLLRSPTWTVEAGMAAGEEAPSDLDQQFADFVQRNFDDLDPGWRSVIADSAEMIVWGFHLAEILYARHDDGSVRWAAAMPLQQRTIEEWKLDDIGRLSQVWQRLEDRAGSWIPHWKLFHFRTKPAAGQPEGYPLVRNAFLPWADKQELRRITKLALRRDWTGIAKMEVPAKILSVAATDDDKAMLSEIEEMVREVERDEREGLVVPAEEDGRGNQTGYKLSLLQSSGTRTVPLLDLWRQHNADLAVGMLSEVVLLGTVPTGVFSGQVAGVKTEWFARAINSFLDMDAEHVEKNALRTLRDLNPAFAQAAIPKLRHSDIDPIDLESLGLFVQRIGAGGFITPESGLEEALRLRAKLPMARGEEEI
ncbi:hypothetical protein LCGC14_1658040 [marine sediment metagenome]|uniref:Portal protein n=1 Tax=marine sediment metagenome TaxID=412755 RepID=A0A0F9IHE1_9ZZZZ